MKEKPIQKVDITPEAKEFIEFMHEFSKESDRAAVILGAAKIELLLYQILMKFFLPAISSTDELFDGEAPLSSFNAKIHITYRLGLINPELTRALHLIRKIRNSFAHEVSGCSLDSGAQRDRVKELVMPLEGYTDFIEGRKAFFQDKLGPSPDFRTALAYIYVRLEILLKKVSTLEILKNPILLIPQKWKKASTD